jgi:hypothetical protein
MSQNSIELKILGADKVSAIVFSSLGTTPQLATAGVPVTTTKNTSAQVVAAHGTILGVVFDSPA